MYSRTAVNSGKEGVRDRVEGAQGVGQAVGLTESHPTVQVRSSRRRGNKQGGFIPFLFETFQFSREFTLCFVGVSDCSETSLAPAS